MKKTITSALLLLLTTLSYAQVKIDSLGIHLGNDGAYIFNIKGTPNEGIYSKAINYISKDHEYITKVIQEQNTGSSLKFTIEDNFMWFYRRTGSDGYIGNTTAFEMEFKNGKCRIKSMAPKFFFVKRHPTDRSEVKEKKKKDFVVVGPGKYAIYDEALHLRKSRRKIKTALENYYNNLIKEIEDHLKNGEGDW